MKWKTKLPAKSGGKDATAKQKTNDYSLVQFDNEPIHANGPMD